MQELTESHQSLSDPVIRNKFFRTLVGAEVVVGVPASMGFWAYILASEIELAGHQSPTAANIVLGIGAAAGTLWGTLQSTRSS